MAYEVATDVFEGPFDVLYRLITTQEVDVHSISLAAIVDSFVAEVQKMAKIDLELATEFAVIAATLIELKSRRLLPVSDDGINEEELLLFEERDLLLTRLVDCRTFQGVAGLFSHSMHLASLSFPRRCGADERFVNLMPELLVGVTAEDLVKALLRIKKVVPPPPPKVDLAHVAPDPAFTINQAAREITSILKSRNRMSFKELTSHLYEKIDIVVFFLSILEMYKRELLELNQGLTLGEIECIWIGSDLDNLDFDYDEFSGETRVMAGADDRD